MASFPNDILLLIGEEFFQRRDFGSLLCFGLTCRSMAAICIPFMYRIQDSAPAKKDDVDTFTPEGSKKFSKWARLWQSICISAAAPESTIMPYVNYVRILDLSDLRNLFDDFGRDGRKKNKDAFFKKELKKYEYMTTGWQNRKVLQGSKVVISIGDEIAKHAVSVEELIGDIPPDALQRWVATMPKLNSLRIWSGKAIVEGAAATLKEHCPAFSKLCVHNFHDLGDSADSQFADFILGLREQSLASVEVMVCRNLGTKTLQALSKTQSRSLRSLVLGTVDEELIVSIGKLEKFPALRSISISGQSLDSSQVTPEVRSTLSSWLGAARDLEELDLGLIKPAGNLLREYLFDFGAECKLRSLIVSRYDLTEKGKEFHESLGVLGNKLESLKLSGYMYELNATITRSYLNALVSSISAMTLLKTLNLYGMSWQLTDQMVVEFLCNLTMLESLDMEGSSLRDVVLETIAGLTKMKSLTLQGDNEFTPFGMTSFLNSVTVGPWGYNVDLGGARDLDENDVATMKAMFAKRGGTFDYSREVDEEDEEDLDGVF